nr:retrovirus-related Pol polyprotein from transposon TNT 1-94 [Tanacetum cinerariifolium]
MTKPYSSLRFIANCFTIDSHKDGHRGNKPNYNADIKENLDAGKVGKETVSAQQYVLLPLWSTSLQDPQNTDADVANAAFNVKENENEVHVSPSGSEKPKKHDDKAKRDDKGKSPIDMPELEDIIYSYNEEDVGAEADFFNLETNITISPIPTTRVHKDHPTTQIIDFPKGKRAIGSKWVFRNKKDERGIVIMNKARLVAEGPTQEEAIDYDEVFALVARIEAIRLFLAYASFMGFMIMDFLNAHAIQYALVLRALIDGKKVVVTEDVIRQDLHLDDADGVECFLNEEIFTELARRKFNFSKYIFDNMVRNVDSPSKFLMVGKGFSRVETPLFSSMLVQPHATEEDEKVEVPTAPAPPSPTNAPSPPPQVPIPTPHASPSSPTQEQPTKTSESSIPLLNTLLMTCATLSQKGRIDQDVSAAATKDVSVTEPTVFDDEEVTMTMAQTLIKMKAEKAKLLDEQIAQRLHDEEIKKAVAREKQEKDYLERVKVLQQQYGYKEENIDWNAIAEKIKEKHLDNIRKYQMLKKKSVKYPIIDWEIHSKGSRSYWKIIRVCVIIEAYQSFEDMLKGFDREDLVALWNLVKEKFSSVMPNVDKEKALWVELKRLFKPYANDVLWKLQRYMHYPITWKLYTNCGVHQVSSITRRHDMFMLIEKDYPLSNGVMTLMLSVKLQVEEDSDMARDIVIKIFMKANKPKSRSLDTSSK